jgi:hypothetical protein
MNGLKYLEPVSLINLNYVVNIIVYILYRDN